MRTLVIQHLTRLFQACLFCARLCLVALPVTLLVGYAILLLLPQMRAYFDLVVPPLSINLGIVLVTVVWAMVQLATWRAHLLERFLGLEPYWIH